MDLWWGPALGSWEGIPGMAEVLAAFAFPKLRGVSWWVLTLPTAVSRRVSPVRTHRRVSPLPREPGVPLRALLAPPGPSCRTAW